MAVKNKFIHFNTRSGFNSQVPNPELNSENGNEFYNYIVFIKESKEIYTHGQFYDCSKYDDTEILQLVNSISDRFDTFESNLNDLTSEVEDNELVAAKALTDLNNKIESVINGANSDSGIVTFERIYPTINDDILEYSVPAGSTCELVVPYENLTENSFLGIVFEGVPENFYSADGYEDNPMLSKYHIRCQHSGLPILFAVDGADYTRFVNNCGVDFDTSLGWCFELDALCEQGRCTNPDTGEEETFGYIYAAYYVFNDPI